jgi:hypothetical protein
MTTGTTDDVERVTYADVRTAEAEAESAERAARNLEDAIAAGDSSVTLEAVEAAERKSRFAGLLAKGQRAKADRYRADVRAKARIALREEIIATAPKSGDEMVKALQAVEDAARAFMRLADEHDARVTDWRARIDAFKIPWGTTEHGIENYGRVTVNGVTINQIEGALRFGALFHNQQTGFAVPLPLRATDDPARLAGYRALDKIGEGL